MLMVGMEVVYYKASVKEDAITNQIILSKSQDAHTSHSKGPKAKIEHKISPMFKQFGLALNNMGEPTLFQHGKSAVVQ